MSKHLSRGGAAVDLIGKNTAFGKLVLVEAKELLHTSDIVAAVDKASDSIDALKAANQIGGEPFVGVETVIITYKAVTGSGIGRFSIDSAGFVYEGGKQVFTGGLPLVAKQIPF